MLVTDEQYKKLGRALCGTTANPREVTAKAKELFGKRAKVTGHGYDRLELLGFVKCVECNTWTDCIAKGYSETCEDCVSDMTREEDEGSVDDDG